MITLHAEKCSIMKSHSPTKALKGYGDGKKKNLSELLHCGELCFPKNFVENFFDGNNK